MTTWATCDAMLSLSTEQQEQLLELIGSQNDSKRIARMLGCAEDIVRLIRAQRQRERKAEQRREQYQLEVNRRSGRKRVADAADWPEVDGRELHKVLIAMGHPLPVNCPAPMGIPVVITGRVSGSSTGLGQWS